MSDTLPLSMEVAVVMRKERIVGEMSRWQDSRWVLEDVVPDEPGFGRAPRMLYHDENQQRWLHPGLTVRLFKDDAEGYLLNVSAPAPCWFVLWRMEEEPGAPASGVSASDACATPAAGSAAVSACWRASLLRRDQRPMKPAGSWLMVRLRRASWWC